MNFLGNPHRSNIVAEIKVSVVRIEDDTKQLIIKIICLCHFKREDEPVGKLKKKLKNKRKKKGD